MDWQAHLPRAIAQNYVLLVFTSILKKALLGWLSNQRRGMAQPAPVKGGGTQLR
jgi:hypothetical protein